MSNLSLSATRRSRVVLRRALVLALTVLFAITIAILTLTPVSVPNALPGNDKIYHLVAFAILVLPSAVFVPRTLLGVLPSSVFWVAPSKSSNPSWAAMVNGQIFTLIF